MVYCRHEKLTGSQFSHKICLSEEQIKLQRKIAQDLLGTVRGLGKCLPPQCNN